LDPAAQGMSAAWPSWTTRIAPYEGSTVYLTRSICMSRRLKVFRTNAGFYDAYIAAPSRLAALAAWGAKGDLFAREAAEEITDPALTAEPLAHPGEVIRKPRGSFSVPSTTGIGKLRKRLPSRVGLDKAEAALAEFEKKAAAQLAAITEREEALVRERIELEERQRAAREKLVKRRNLEQEKFEAMTTAS